MSEATSITKTIQQLTKFWKEKGDCENIQPIDHAVGAATFHPTTFFSILRGDEKNYCFAQSCQRPADEIPSATKHRLKKYIQYQVIIQNPPDKILKLFMHSLEIIGINNEENHIQFVRDDWKSITIGAFGRGWEVVCNGSEIAQITYMEKLGGVSIPNNTIEITYGVERVCMQSQQIFNMLELDYSDHTKYNELIEAYESSHPESKKSVKAYMRLFSINNSLAKREKETALYLRAVEMSNLLNLIDAKTILLPDDRFGYVQKIYRHFNTVAENINSHPKPKERINLEEKFSSIQKHTISQAEKRNRIEMVMNAVSEVEGVTVHLSPDLYHQLKDELVESLIDPFCIKLPVPHIAPIPVLAIFLCKQLKGILISADDDNQLFSLFFVNKLSDRITGAYYHAMEARLDHLKYLIKKDESLDLLSIVPESEIEQLLKLYTIIEPDCTEEMRQSIALYNIGSYLPTVAEYPELEEEMVQYHLQKMDKKGGGSVKKWTKMGGDLHHIIQAAQFGRMPKNRSDPYKVRRAVYSLIKSSTDIPIYRVIERYSNEEIAKEICSYIFTRYAPFGIDNALTIQHISKEIQRDPDASIKKAQIYMRELDSLLQTDPLDQKSILIKTQKRISNLLRTLGEAE